jgi:glycosyltransferase involved in cell wall biosynthesis
VNQGNSAAGARRSPPRVELLRAGPTDAPPPSPSRPHILLAVDQLPRTLGGGERVVLRLAHLLPAYGYRVSILTLAADPESAALAEPVPCPIYLLPLHRTFGPEALRAAIELRRFLRREDVHLVQTFFESSDLFIGPIAKLLGHTKLIWSRRDMGILRGPKHHLAYRLLRNLPNRVFAVSEEVRRYTIDVDRIAPDRVETLYNGLDLSSWLGIHAERSSRGPSIVTVGNIRRVKGHDVFLRAAAILAPEFPTAHFSIAGQVLEPDFYAELQALVSQLHLEDRFTFAGNVTDLPSFLRTADLFVLPSRSEGFSNAIVEAMAAALPVVATRVGGNAEAVLDGATGRIVPPENVDALASALREILSAPDLAKTMGRAGRQRVADRFTTEAMMKQLVAVYQNLLATP